MRPRSFLLVALALLIAATATASPRRRAVRVPPSDCSYELAPSFADPVSNEGMVRGSVRVTPSAASCASWPVYSPVGWIHIEVEPPFASSPPGHSRRGCRRSGWTMFSCGRGRRCSPFPPASVIRTVALEKGADDEEEKKVVRRSCRVVVDRHHPVDGGGATDGALLRTGPPPETGSLYANGQRAGERCPSRFVIGESAGANLGALVSVEGHSGAAVLAFIGIGGYYKLDDEADDSPVGDRVLAYLGCVISQCGNVIKQASPWWNSMVTPKMLLIHGELDGFVHYTQSQKMAQRNGLNNSEVIIVPGAGHTGVEFNTPKLDEAILSLVFSFE